MRLLRVRDTHMQYAERCTCISLCCSDCVSLACDYGCACVSFQINEGNRKKSAVWPARQHIFCQCIVSHCSLYTGIFHCGEHPLLPIIAARPTEDRSAAAATPSSPPAASPASLAAAARALCSERDAAVPSLPPLPPRVASRAADAAVACVGPHAAWPVDVAPRRLSLWRDRARRRHQLARRRRAQVGRPLRSRACGGLAGDVGPLREAVGQRGDRLVEGGLTQEGGGGGGGCLLVKERCCRRRRCLPHERGRGAVINDRLSN